MGNASTLPGSEGSAGSGISTAQAAKLAAAAQGSFDALDETTAQLSLLPASGTELRAVFLDTNGKLVVL